MLINTMPGFKASLWFFVIPAVNAVLLFKEVMIGLYDGGHIAVTGASLAVFGVLFRD